MRRIAAQHCLDARGSSHDVVISVDGGEITSVDLAGSVDGDTVILPALTNAHDHARPLRTSSIGGFGKPLEIWLHRLALMVPVDPYLAALAPLARAALGGQGGVMIHATRAMGLTDLPTEVRDVARAARDVGLRIAFGIGMRDQNPLVYGDHGDLLDALDAEPRRDRTAFPWPDVAA